MNAKSFALLAAVIFAIVAVLHLIRAIAGWPVSIDMISVPIWVSWVACAITAVLAWVGLAASRA